MKSHKRSLLFLIVYAFNQNREMYYHVLQKKASNCEVFVEEFYFSVMFKLFSY